MKTSEALRKGCVNKQQIRGSLFGPHNRMSDNDITKCCAEGAILLGNDRKYPPQNNSLKKASCPYDSNCHKVDGNSMYGIINHLNDYHFWSFIQVADWLESIGE